MKNYMYLNTLFIIILFLNYNQIYSDIPSQCKSSEIKGKWEFYISDKSFNPQLLNPETACGHSFPNKIEKIIGNEDNYPKNYINKFILELNNDHKVAEKGSFVGDWTPVYLQGFLVNYKESVLVANFKYYMEHQNDTNYITDCSKTSIGWFIPNKENKHKNWRCFYAKKIITQNSFLKQISNSFLQIKSKKKTYNKQYLFSTKYDDTTNIVNKINDANLTWKAEVNPMFIGKSLYEVRQQLGMNKGINRIPQSEYEDYLKKFNNNTNISNTHNYKTINKKKTHKNLYSHPILAQIKVKKINLNEEMDSYYINDRNEVLKYLNTKIDDINVNELPRNWDWRNVGGMNFIPDSRSQGNCGSCYTIATIGAIESRLRIKTYNEDQTEFSIKFPLKCNFYSEGCDGGFPILLGKFFNEFEVIPSECLNEDLCTNICKNKKKYVVGNYGYIGKFYPGTNEIDMMKELRARGPIMAAMIIESPFYHYKSGIYSNKPLLKNSKFISNSSPFDDNIEYVKEDHSILIVGYGEENGIKYWICQNSWGEDFGEDGFFRILRGENDSNIEGMAEYITIDIYDN